MVNQPFIWVIFTVSRYQLPVLVIIFVFGFDRVLHRLLVWITVFCVYIFWLMVYQF